MVLHLMNELLEAAKLHESPSVALHQAIRMLRLTAEIDDQEMAVTRRIYADPEGIAEGEEPVPLGVLAPVESEVEEIELAQAAINAVPRTATSRPQCAKCGAAGKAAFRHDDGLTRCRHCAHIVGSPLPAHLATATAER